VTKFTDKQHSVCADTLCSNHRHVLGSLESSVLAAKASLQNARSSRQQSSCQTVNSSQCRYARRSTRHTILGDFRVWRVDHVTSWLAPLATVKMVPEPATLWYHQRDWGFFQRDSTDGDRTAIN